MTDLISLMSSLVDNKGRILVPGICDSVQKLEEAEAKLYEPIDFDMVQFILNFTIAHRCSLFDCFLNRKSALKIEVNSV